MNVLSQLRIRPAGDRFTVWTRFACLADFPSFQTAAEYIRRACCFRSAESQSAVVAGDPSFSLPAGGKGDTSTACSTNLTKVVRGGFGVGFDF